jgi:phage terminase large subunit-like protein
MDEREGSKSLSLVKGSTFDNKLNLSEDFLRDIKRMYEGTALGRQELYGEMLDGFEGALFPYSVVENHRVTIGPEKVAHRTVGVDPGLTGNEDGDETGVIVVCRDVEDHMFVVADETVKLSGRDAALHAWRVFERYGCDTLVYESNLGKAWMQQVFTDAFRELQRSGVFPSEVTTPPLVPVFSTQGKKLRAEPVAMRYGQGRVHHIGTFETLENQMYSFDPITSKVSPDRLDALVHACRHLMEGERRPTRLLSPLNYKMDTLGQPRW